jgi:hypothetical protein
MSMEMNKQKKGLLKWNLKIHIYIGLYLLFFIWLFGFSGLLLNHHWKFANFWDERKEASFERTFTISGEREQYTLVHDIMHKIDLNGSISNLKFSEDSIFLNFIISKPGTRYDIQANLIDGNILIKEMRFNKWGIMRALHVLRNPSLKKQGDRYQSAIAYIWSISMDIVSVSLILLCFGGWYLWIKTPRKRFFRGLIAVASGFIICICFLFFLS